MKKIVMYIDSMCKGGAQRVMLNLAEYFLSKDISVVLVNDFAASAEKEYEVPDGIKRVFLRASLKGNPLLKNLQRIIKLRDTIKAERPDIVLSFLGRPNMRMLVAAIGLKCKKVVSVRNDPRREYGASKIKQMTAGLLFHLADGCVFQTQEAAGYFPKKVSERSRIIPNPVAEAFYHIERAEEPRNIVSVGRLEKQKDHLLLIDAFALVADEFPEEDLIIYGEGSLRKTLEDEMITLGLEGRVSLPGETKNVAEELAKAKVFVLSSDFEGMPNALLEAMAVGLPCISTDCPCGGPREMIDHDRNGLIVECGNREELARAIRELLKDEAKRHGLAEGAKRKAMSYQAERVNEIWDNYFTDILSAAHG